MSRSLHQIYLNQKYYLYYFLLQFPNRGRTLVFANAITCVRRVADLFATLNFQIYPLHAQQQQRQRLKNLERFQVSKDGIIVCTDVAARGLDIPGVESVVHYQLARAPEVYIHRSGRTARAGSHGVSLILLGEQADEQSYYRKIMNELGKEGMDSLEVNVRTLKALRERVTLARTIHDHSNRLNRSSAHNNWLQKAAEEMDIELDNDLLVKITGKKRRRQDQEREDEDENQKHGNKTVASMKEENALKKLRKQLKSLLSKPV